LETAAALLGLSMDEVQEQLSLGTGEVPEARGGGDRGPASSGSTFRGNGSRRDQSLFGGTYVAFVLREGVPCAVRVRTGLTDFDYTAVVSGLAESDTVIVLATAGLIESFQRTEERARERAGSPLGN
jgi:hypothetical protein